MQTSVAVAACAAGGGARLTLLGVLAAVGLGAAGCGQKGPLTLPKTPPVAPAVAASAAAPR